MVRLDLINAVVPIFAGVQSNPISYNPVLMFLNRIPSVVCRAITTQMFVP